VNEYGQIRRHRSFALAAGWMIIIAGVISFFNGFMSLLGQNSFDLYDFVLDIDRYSLCAILISVFGIVAIVGGISAIRGRNLSLVLVGAGLGVLGGGIIGFWLGITALLFLFMSSEDF
jgi:hypothetical protein